MKNYRNGKLRASAVRRITGRTAKAKIKRGAKPIPKRHEAAHNSVADKMKVAMPATSRKTKRPQEMNVVEARGPDVDALFDNAVFSDYISRNVGKKAITVAKMLRHFQTDEKLAAELGIKINEVRRILNVLDTYGVARYDADKDSKGWLTFRWHIDADKLEELHNHVVNEKPRNDEQKMPDDCNDFFFCEKCYNEQKIIMPFDAAYELSFKCEDCGRVLTQMSKDEVRAVFVQEGAVSIV